MKIISNKEEEVIYDIILEQKKRISEQELLIERLKEQVKHLELKLDLIKKMQNYSGFVTIDFPNSKCSEDK